MLGVHATGRLDVDFFTLFNREARIIPSLGYCAHESGREMEDAAAMLAADPTIADALITHRFPIEDAAEAFRVAGDRSQRRHPGRGRARRVTSVRPARGDEFGLPASSV